MIFDISVFRILNITSAKTLRRDKILVIPILYRVNAIIKTAQPFPTSLMFIIHIYTTDRIKTH